MPSFIPPRFVSVLVLKGAWLVLIWAGMDGAAVSVDVQVFLRYTHAPPRYIPRSGRRVGHVIVLALVFRSVCLLTCLLLHF